MVILGKEKANVVQHPPTLPFCSLCHQWEMFSVHLLEALGCSQPFVTVCPYSSPSLSPHVVEMPEVVPRPPVLLVRCVLGLLPVTSKV